MKILSNRALISRTYVSANQHLETINFEVSNWSEWYDAVQSLNTPQKMVYLIIKMNQSVTNGGFAEFYNNSFGIFAPELVYVLGEIKANDSADIVSSSLSIVNPDGLLDDDYKSFVFKVQLSEEQKKALFSCDMQYDNLQDIENLEDLLGDYLQELVNLI